MQADVRFEETAHCRSPTSTVPLGRLFHAITQFLGQRSPVVALFTRTYKKH